MVKKFLTIFLLFSLAGMAAFGIRAYLQMRARERPYFVPEPREKIAAWKGREILLQGKRLKDQDCLAVGERCMCLSTLPHRFRKVLERPLASLPAYFAAGAGGKTPLRIEGWKRCGGTAFEVRKRGKRVEIRSCQRGYILQGCSRKPVKPGNYYPLKAGEVLYLPDPGVRIEIAIFRASLPRKVGKTTRIFRVERKNLVVEVEESVEPRRAFLKNSLTLPLRNGFNSFYPASATLPVLPPYYYTPQREVFLYLFLEGGYYSLKNGFYRAVAKGPLKRVGERTGDWKYFKGEINKLNSSIGNEGIFSRMPCWKAGSLSQFQWFYSATAGENWKFSSSLRGWTRAEKRGKWTCGPPWDPHFPGERTVYFKAVVQGPRAIEISPPPRGFLFLNGRVAGKGKADLSPGRNLLALRLKIKGMGKPDGKIRVSRDLKLKITAPGRAGVGVAPPTLHLRFRPSVPILSVLRGKYRGTAVGLPTYLLVEPSTPVRIRIDHDVVQIPLKETKTPFYTLRKIRGNFALGDVVILKGGELWVLNSPRQISAGGDNLLQWKGGQLFWGGEKYQEGETLSRGGEIFLVGTEERGEALNCLLPYISHTLKGRVKLTVRRDLQEISYSLLKDRLLRIREREERNTSALRAEISSLKRRLSRLKKIYEKTGERKGAEEILRLESLLEEKRYLLWKVKNPFYEGAVVILDENGAVLASASYPPDGLNRGWGETYNVGSTFKLVDSVAFLSSKSPTVKRLLRNFPFTGPGSENLKGKALLTGRRINFDLRNFRGERVPPGVDFESALAHSYNVYFAYIAMHLYPPLLEGREQVILPLNRLRKAFPLLGYAEALGFNSRFDLTPIPGAVLSAPSVFPINAYKLSEIAHYSIGQAGLRATALQMALVALSIARGGTLPRPFLVEEVKFQGKTVGFPRKEKRVFSEQVARRIEEAMKRVVTEGTARRAFGGWPWRDEVFGKTGTAETSLYRDNSMFVGYLKHRGRILAFAVFLPRSGTGSREAAPLARDVLESYIKYLEEQR